MLNKLWANFCALVYPHNCTLCKQSLNTDTSSHPLCPRCQESIRLNNPPFCTRCSRTLLCNPENDVCSCCREATYSFDRVWSATVYNETMKRLIHLFKYSNKTSLKNYFSFLILHFLQTYHIDMTQHDIMISIPLHPTRLRERGYNQSQLITDIIGKTYNLKTSIKNLVRVRNTKYQARLHQKERWTNIHGAFKIKNSSHVDKKNVLLFDDLFTTGATVSEAARILKEAGAKKINILTLAIAN